MVCSKRRVRFVRVPTFNIPLPTVFAMGFAFSATITAPGALAAAYKWTDPSGQTNYGEKAPAGAIDVRQIEVYECITVECKEEEAQRKADQLEIQRQTEEWLAKRNEIKEHLIETRVQQPVYVPIYVPPAAPWIFEPRLSHSGLRHSTHFGHRRFGRHRIHGTGRKSRSTLQRSVSRTPRTFSFP